MLSLPTFDCAHLRSISFKEGDANMVLRSSSFKKDDADILPTPKSSGKIVLGHSPSFKNWEPEEKKTLEATDSFNKQSVDQSTCAPLHRIGGDESPNSKPAGCRSLELISPRPKCELDAAAVKLQKVYKSYRTRRNLADCAVLVEELWWKALDFACLKQSSVSFFKEEKQETATSRWTRAKRRVAKVGKGLSKDKKARKLALQHWLEAIDPRHRYGHNLHIYYDVWFASESTQPFFYWLDVGDGKDKNLPKCPRNKLQQQCIKYLGPNEREAYEVIVTDGKLVYKQSDLLLNTDEGSKWIFVLSTSRKLYVGQKKKGTFQHSSFLAGAATTAAGRVVAKDGILKAIWPYSGHYLPTEENFKEFICFLAEHNLDLTNVTKCSVDDLLLKKTNTDLSGVLETLKDAPKVSKITEMEQSKKKAENLKQPAFEFSKQPSCKWTTGAGPRITCVRDYPSDLQFKALEQVNLSPRVPMSPITNKVPIPSPRPGPNVRLSPRLAAMGIPSPAPVPSPRPSPSKHKVSPRLGVIGIPSPKVSLTLPNFKKNKQQS